MIDRKKIHLKYNGKCGYCGKDIDIKDMQIDHIIPKRNFVSDVKNNIKVPDFLKHLTIVDVNHFDNLMPSCRVCNNWKKTFYLELFRYEIGEQVKRLKAYSANYRLATRYGLIEETEKPIVFYFEKIDKEV